MLLFYYFRWILVLTLRRHLFLPNMSSVSSCSLSRLSLLLHLQMLSRSVIPASLQPPSLTKTSRENELLQKLHSSASILAPILRTIQSSF
jgi:hypothetical protein